LKSFKSSGERVCLGAAQAHNTSKQSGQIMRMQTTPHNQ